MLLVGGLPHLVRVFKESSSDCSVDNVVQEGLPVADDPIVLGNKSVCRVLANLSNESGLVVGTRQSLHSVKVNIGVRRSSPQVGIIGSSVSSIGGDDINVHVFSESIVCRRIIDESIGDGNDSVPSSQSVVSGVIEEVIEKIDQSGLSSGSKDGKLVSDLPHQKSAVVSNFIDKVSNIGFQGGDIGHRQDSLFGIHREDDFESACGSLIHERNVINS